MLAALLAPGAGWEGKAMIAELGNGGSGSPMTSQNSVQFWAGVEGIHLSCASIKHDWTSYEEGCQIDT